MVDLPGVGRNLADHLFVPFAFSAATEHPVTGRSVYHMAKAALEYAKDKTGPVSQALLMGTSSTVFTVC